MNQASLCLFGDAKETARREAIDELHAATSLYTRTPVVEELLDLLPWPRAGARFADVSCGDGVIVEAGLKRLLGAQLVRDDQLPEFVSGWELHPHAAAEARTRIASMLVAHGRSWSVAHGLAERIITNRDFLTEGPTSPTFDLLVVNPPYARMSRVPGLLREEYMGVVPKIANKDLLHSFLERCSRTLREGGVLGAVTADRWLTNLGAADLRAHLGDRFSVCHLHRLDASTAFYKPKLRRAGTPPRVHPVLIVLGPGGSRPLGRAALHIDAGADAYADLPTLGSLATLRIAPWLGPDGIFLVTLEQARAAGIPDEMLVPAIGARQLRGTTIGPIERYAIDTKADQVPGAAGTGTAENAAARATQGRMAAARVLAARGPPARAPRGAAHYPDTSRALRPAGLPPFQP